MFNKIKSAVQALKSKFVKLSLVASVALAASGSALADGNTSAIEAAIASGQSSVSLVTAGVIALAALGFGLTMIVTWLRR